MGKDKKVSVTFTAEEYAKIRHLALEQNRSVPNYIQQLVMVSINSDRDLLLEMNPVLEPIIRRIAAV